MPGTFIPLLSLNPRHPQSIHHACDRTFRAIEDGYEDVERLYRWCHRNESHIWAWVETYRAEEELDFYGNTETGRFHADLDGEHHYASVGETVKVTLRPDPAKHDIVQTPAEASAESYPPDDE